MNREISDLLTALRPIAAQASTKSQHWIGGSDNEAENYCRDCAEAKIAQLRVAKPDGEFFIDGGWEAHEADHCVHCATCGVLLDYSLTDYGVSTELDHYTRHMKRKGPLPPEDAYHIVAALEQVEWSDDKDAIKRATRVGQRAIALVAA